jgi:hypothetical protein
LSVLAFLIPIGFLGLLAWAAVGFRSRGTEAFTLATATALYARVLLIAGVLTSLTGAGTILKAMIGYINIAYSYYGNQYYSGYAPLPSSAPLVQQPVVNYVEQQRGQDLVLGITLLVVGILVAVAHLYLAKAVAGMAGGSRAWVTRGTLLALTVMTAIAGIPSAAVGLYQMLSYFIVGTSQYQQQQPWGEPLGLAIAFVPAWVYFMTRLVQDLRRPHMGATGT